MTAPGDLYLDPIDEMPEAVWYVRPPSGGQFGPAAGQVMRTWIAQGRVPGDALVWRAGWSQWQSAAAVFPNLGAHLAPPVVGASLDAGPPVQALSDTADTPDQWTVKPHAKPNLPGPEPNQKVVEVMLRAGMRRKQTQQQLLIATGVLVVVALALAILLINVLK